MTTEQFIECTKDSMEEFTLYDKNVDVVTSWESFVRPYRTHFPDFNFDRFPSYKSEKWKNPNFTIFFDSRYALSFITYHRSGVIETPASFERELKKLRELENDIKFENRDGRLTNAKSQDIVLLCESGCSQTLGHKIEKKIAEGDLDLDANIILLEFDYLEEDNSKYRFRRLSHPDQNFRDDILPDAGKLSTKLSIEGEKFENIQVPLDDDFAELKATGIFTNRTESDLYLACRLWDTIIKDKLNDDEWGIWRKEDPKKKIEKQLSCSNLADEISTKYVPGANVSQGDVKRALRYIAVAKRAVQISDDEFRVQYSNLIEKRREHKDTASERSDVRDLAYLFSSWYCETKTGKDYDEIADIVTTESYNRADLSGITGADTFDM
jgi:hypothetical protein